MAPAATDRPYPPPGQSVPGDEEALMLQQTEKKPAQAQTLLAGDLSSTAGLGRCESGSPPLHRRPGTSPILAHCH